MGNGNHLEGSGLERSYRSAILGVEKIRIILFTNLYQKFSFLLIIRRHQSNL